MTETDGNMETNGENYGISTRKVVAALSEINQQNPFEILGAGLDFADIRFCESIHDPLALAHEIYDICPDSVEQHCGTITNLANQIDQTRRLYLWWD